MRWLGVFVGLRDGARTRTRHGAVHQAAEQLLIGRRGDAALEEGPRPFDSAGGGHDANARVQAAATGAATGTGAGPQAAELEPEPEPELYDDTEGWVCDLCTLLNEVSVHVRARARTY